MPFGDGTGPRGLGPMTGRRAGYCAGFSQPGFANPIARRGWFGFNPARQQGYPYPGNYAANTPYFGFGRGFGWRRFNRRSYPW
jgi:hypothetical protein